jgi:hypothetical protein
VAKFKPPDFAAESASKTPEGRARIADAQRKRWSAWQEQKEYLGGGSSSRAGWPCEAEQALTLVHLATA